MLRTSDARLLGVVVWTWEVRMVDLDYMSHVGCLLEDLGEVKENHAHRTDDPNCPANLDHQEEDLVAEA